MTHLTTEEQHVMSGSHLSPGVEPGHVVGVVLVQPDGGDCMSAPGLLHLPHLFPVLPSPLVYFLSVTTVTKTS